MNFSLFIAKRVASKAEQSFSLLIIRIAVAAIAISMTVMIVATAMIAGFKNEISTKIFGFWGHIHIVSASVHRSYEAMPIAYQQPFLPRLDSVGQVDYLAPRTFLGYEIGDQLAEYSTHGGIRHVQAYAYIPGIIKSKTEIEGISLKGVGRDFDWNNLKPYLLEGRAIQFNDTSASRDIIISQQTANRLNLAVDDKFVLHFVQSGQPLRRRFQVSGIYKTGLEEYDRLFALADLQMVQELLGWRRDQVGGFEVFVDDIRDMEAINEYIYIEELPNNLFSQTIRDKNPAIFDWLGLQDINEVVILILMVIVAIINMVTALMILILERTNMIGTLKALGASSWSIRKIFLYHAAIIIGMGLLIGNLLGIGLCWIQDRFELIQLSEADYYLSVAPIEFNFWTILLLNVGTLFVTLLFLIIPSYLVTSISPVKAIRFK